MRLRFQDKGFSFSLHKNICVVYPAKTHRYIAAFGHVHRGDSRAVGSIPALWGRLHVAIASFLAVVAKLGQYPFEALLCTDTVRVETVQPFL